MGLLDSAEEEWLEALFATDKLSDVVYRDSVDSLLVGFSGSTFDLHVKVNPRAFSIFKDCWIGVAYAPSGPVLRGVQAVREGQTLVFRNLTRKPGAELVVAMDFPLSVEVHAMPTGSSVPTTEGPPPVISTGGGAGIGFGLGAGGALVLLLAVLWFAGPPRGGGGNG